MPGFLEKQQGDTYDWITVSNEFSRDEIGKICKMLLTERWLARGDKRSDSG